MSSWYDDSAFLGGVRDKLVRNVTAAGEQLAKIQRQSLNTPYPPASAPGESPHRRTGDLQASVTSEVDETDGDRVTARVGTPLAYGRYLEFGTGRQSEKSQPNHPLSGMAPRPWLRRSLLNNLQPLSETVTKGIGHE